MAVRALHWFLATRMSVTPGSQDCKHSRRAPPRSAGGISAMPDPIYSNSVMIAQLAIMLLIPLEILLAATLRIKADYEMRDTVATMAISVGSIYLWGMLGWLFF